MVADLSLMGFDLSDANPINYQQAKDQGYSWGAVKLTESTTFVDPSGAKHYKGMGAAGLYRCPYSVISPNRPADQQALFFIEVMKSLGHWELPAWLDCERGDFEKYHFSANQKILKLWIETWRFVTQSKPLFIYTAPWWWDNWIGEWDFVKDIPLVIADYYGNIELPLGFSDYIIHQRNSVSKIGGFYPVDEDIAKPELWDYLEKEEEMCDCEARLKDHESRLAVLESFLVPDEPLKVNSPSGLWFRHEPTADVLTAEGEPNKIRLLAHDEKVFKLSEVQGSEHKGSTLWFELRDGNNVIGFSHSLYLVPFP